MISGFDGGSRLDTVLMRSNVSCGLAWRTIGIKIEMHNARTSSN